jgi:tRNA A-37 threonylcarbamoyl transferase component Bud32
VYDFAESPGAVLKLAKPRTYSREHVRQECELTEFFARHGVPVPAITEWDRYGSFCVKQRLAGESLAVIYTELGLPDAPRHRRVRAAVAEFTAGLIELFAAHPEAKTSISPNNIFVVEDGSECRCLLVDAGPAPFHDYSSFDFTEYWETTVPRKIAQYRSVGFI